MNANIDSRARRPGVSLAMLLAASLLVGFSMGRWLAPLAAWIGPALIIRYARDHKPGRGYLLVLAAWILAVFIGFGAFFSQPLGAFIDVLNGLLMSLPYLADRLLFARLRGFSGTFVFPLAATTLEFFFIHTNPVGTWGLSNDNDDFRFEYSTDGSNFLSLVLVNAYGGDADSYVVADLPPSVTGTITIRVVDTNRAQGTQFLDTVYVDELFVRVVP